MAIRSSKDSVKGAINTIKEGQGGKYKPIQTRFTHLNDVLHGGIPRQKIITIGALSSFGKSHNLRQIEEDIFDEKLNPGALENVILCKCDFEMSKEESIISKVHEKTGRPFKEILYDEPDEEIKKAFNEVYLELSRNHIYETFDTYKPDAFYDEIVAFVQPFLNEFTDTITGHTEEKKDADGKIIEPSVALYEEKNENYKQQIVLSIDNINLIDDDGSNESAAIGKLITHLIRLKRDIKSLTIIILAQLNRDLKMRINPKEHFPRTSDFYNSSKIEHASDVQIIIHIPYLLGYSEYGAVNYERFEYLSEYLEEKNKYAVFNTKGLAFWHYVKVRIKGSMKDFRDVYVEKIFNVGEDDTEVHTRSKTTKPIFDDEKPQPIKPNYNLDEAFGPPDEDDDSNPF
jgi:hypothetical protein